MKSLTAITVILFFLLISSVSYSQTSQTSQVYNNPKSKFIKYISLEMGYGGTEASLSNKDDYSNTNFVLNSGNRMYFGASAKIPYVVVGLYYYQKLFDILYPVIPPEPTAPYYSKVEGLNSSYLSVIALYDLLELNVNKKFFINLKVGGNASVFLSEKQVQESAAPSSFNAKPITFGINAKLESTFNVQDIGIMAGVDYTHDLSDALTYTATPTHKYGIKNSTFRFYGGIRKYF